MSWDLKPAGKSSTAMTVFRFLWFGPKEEKEDGNTRKKDSSVREGRASASTWGNSPKWAGR